MQINIDVVSRSLLLFRYLRSGSVSCLMAGNFPIYERVGNCFCIMSLICFEL